MKIVFLLISVILLFQIAIFGQDKDVCVEIKTVDKIGVGETLKVTADLKVDYLVSLQKLHWKTSNGQTQTTDDFVAQFAINKEDAGKTIKVSLEFEGLPDNCLKVYEKEVEVQKIAPIIDPDSFPNNSPWSDEKNRLFALSTQLQEDKTKIIYITISTITPNSKKLAQRKSKIINYLNKGQKIARERIRILVLKSKLEITEYWVVGKDDKLPIN